MPSTEHNRLYDLSSLLFKQDPGLSRHATVNQVSLLATWAWLSHNSPELGLPKPGDGRGVTAALTAIEEVCFEPGVKLSYRADLLELECPGRVMQSLEEMTAKLFWPDLNALIRDLIDMAKDHSWRSRVETTLPIELASVMASLGNVEGRSLLATYPMSDVPMVLAEAATSRTLVMQKASPLAEALAIIGGAKRVQETPENTQLTADVVLSSPPWGTKSPANRDMNKGVGSSEGIALHDAWQQSRQRAVVLLAPHVLSRGKESLLREELVRANAIDMVIQLPERTLWHTAVAPVLVVLDHQRGADAPTLFVDANRLLAEDRQDPVPVWRRSHNDEFWEALTGLAESPEEGRGARFVSKAEIEKNAFDLSVKRYLIGEATQKVSNLENTRPLFDVAEIIRAQMLKSEEGDDGQRVIEVGGRDIDDTGFIRLQETPKEVVVSGRARNRAEQQRLYSGDILLIGKGSIGKVALVGDDCNDHWVAGQVFLIIRAKERDVVKPEYLYRYLASPLMQQYLEEIASGSGIPVLKANDIKTLPVPVTSIAEQERVIDVHRQIMEEYEAIKAHQDKIKQLSQQHWAI